MQKNRVKHKEIILIGAGLYGCLLAYFLKRKGHNITLVEKGSNLFSGFEPVKIGKYKINNGFHGIEYPRAKDLKNFLQNKMHLRLKKGVNIRKILIENEIIDTKLGIRDYPSKLRKIYKLKNLKTYEGQSLNFFFKKDFLKKIDNNLKKFSNDKKISKKFVLPWFLPSNVKNKLSDEGMVFRDRVKQKKIKAYYYYPKNGLFFELNKIFSKKFKQMKINIKLNTKVVLKKGRFFLLSKETKKEISIKKYLIYNCSSSIFMLHQYQNTLIKKLIKNKRYFYNILLKIKEKNKHNKFSEIICMSKDMPLLNRISIPHHIKQQSFNFLQLECISRKKNIAKKDLINLKNNIKKSLNLKFCKVEGFKLSRIVYYPSDNWTKLATKKNYNFLKRNNINIKNRNFFSPINMTKAWNWAIKDSVLN